jgi:hypothetical protein
METRYDDVAGRSTVRREMFRVAEFIRSDFAPRTYLPFKPTDRQHVSARVVDCKRLRKPS